MRWARETGLHRRRGEVVARRDGHAGVSQPDPQPMAAQAGAGLVAEHVVELTRRNRRRRVFADSVRRRGDYRRLPWQSRSSALSPCSSSAWVAMRWLHLPNWCGPSGSRWGSRRRRSEVRAVYGGFGLAIAGVLAYAAIADGDLRTGVLITVGPHISRPCSGTSPVRHLAHTFHPGWTDIQLPDGTVI
jgi:hypothetical protein